MTEEGNNLRHQFLQCWFLKQSQFCQARQCIQSFANNKLFSVTQTLQRIKQELAISWRKKQPKCNYTSQNHYNTSTPSDVTWEILIIEGKSTEKLVSGTLHHATVSRLLENQWGRTQHKWAVLSVRASNAKPRTASSALFRGLRLHHSLHMSRSQSRSHCVKFFLADSRAKERLLAFLDAHQLYLVFNLIG